MNPWELVELSDYEEHMQLPDVAQLRTLSGIMKKQLKKYPVKTAAVLGVAGGNGLEHVDTSQITRVYGIDINEKYLAVCKKRFPHLGDCLCTMKLDLCDDACALPTAGLYIANLFIEYICSDTFIRHIGKTAPRHLSCVIQKNGDAPFISHSPYQDSLIKLSDIHSDIDASALTAGLSGAGYRLVLTEEYPLPNGKSLIRLDYSRQPC